MKRIVYFFILLAAGNCTYGQHTFSIVAVDTVTGEVGSAGATCLNGAGGNPSAIIISDVLPGLGAIHTQAQWDPDNQYNAHDRAMQGDSAAQIISYVTANDVQGSPQVRQYGVALLKGGHPQTAAYTGTGCLDYKNHITGRFYTIQGNILIGQKVLDSMEARFLRSGGPLHERLMAALQGAKIPGADSRCLSEGISSKSAFIRVARPGNSASSLYLDIKVVTTPTGYDPIDSVQIKYTYWRNTAGMDNMGARQPLMIYPNPATDAVTLTTEQAAGSDLRYRVSDLSGKTLLEGALHNTSTPVNIDHLETGMYLIGVYRQEQLIGAGKLLKATGR